MTSHRALHLPGAAALLALAVACTAPARPSVVLITIDTLRADHLGCYGYGRPTTPHIDALAKESLLFERAYTTLPRTTQSVASIMTGRYPKSHGARGLFSRLPATNQTLAEILKARGYATAAVVSNTFLRPGQGFEQGFDIYDNPEERWDADAAMAVTTRAAGWIDGRGESGPFFLWCTTSIRTGATPRRRPGTAPSIPASRSRSPFTTISTGIASPRDR